MKFTGERYLPGRGGDIEIEHRHRYLCAADLVTGKDVLDIACGEGYGAEILAQVARSVIGVDISEEAVEHAKAHYRNANLSFLTGSAAKIPLPTASVDVVVSFETIEHHAQHEEMLAEIKRVLRPGGLCIISSPDKRVYSELPKFSNPFHVKELSRSEFETLVHSHFAHVSIYGQRVIYGSILLIEGKEELVNYRKDAEKAGGVERVRGLVDPMYLIALASDAPLPKLNGGVFEGSINDNEQVLALKRNLSAREFEIEEFREGRTSLEQGVARLKADLEGTLATVSAQKHEIEEFREGRAAMEKVIAHLKVDLENSMTTTHLRNLEIIDLRAELARLKNSWSWILTEPARWVADRVIETFQTIRDVCRQRLLPIHHLERAGEGFVSTGNDPQFKFIPAWPKPRPGWALLSFKIVSDELDIRPILYAFSGPEGARVTSFGCAINKARVGRRFIQLPDELKSLRFDPTDRAGVSFSLQQFSIRNVSAVALLREGYANLNETDRQRLIKDALLCRHNPITVLRQSGLNALNESLRNYEYQIWTENYDTLSETDLARIKQLGTELASKPLLSVVMPVYNTRPKYLSKAIDSVLAQTYENWELCIADDKSTNPEIRKILEDFARRDPRIKVAFREKNGHISAASNTAIDLAQGPFIVLMDHDDALPPHALYMVADEIVSQPDADLIYTDEDKIDEWDRRHDPHFKTDWNRELFYSQNMVAHLGVYRTSIVRKIGGFRVGLEGSQDYDFTLRFLRHTEAGKIRHIPHVLYHWRIFPGVSSFSTDAPQASYTSAYQGLTEYFAEVEPTSKVLPIQSFPGWWRIQRQLPDILPRVSLIVPTRDGLDLLQTVMTGLLEETRYANLEVIIADNESAEHETLAYFKRVSKDPRVKVLRVPGVFNYSHINNRAAEIATGSIIGFINSDIKVIHDDWLLELVAQISQPNVGAVGAKLYYAQDTIQHAGVTLGMTGVANHGHKHFARNSIGYFGRPILVQNVSAVTAACMLVQKDIFQQVGGFDETNLTVGYNDVDLCLKIRETGRDIVFTPFAELYHLESASRGENRTPAQMERDTRERDYMLKRWGSILRQDPFYNPNLTLESEGYSLAFPPRAQKKWSEPILENHAANKKSAPPAASSPLETLRTFAREAQHRFDQAHPANSRAVAEIASNSSIIVIGVAPFSNVAMLVEEFAEQPCVVGELIIVEATAEEPRLVSIRDHLAAWKIRLPLTRFVVVPYSRQEVRFSDAINEGFALSKQKYVWIAGSSFVPIDRCFEYLFKTMVVEPQAIAISYTASAAGNLRASEVPPILLNEEFRKNICRAENVDFLNHHLLATTETFSKHEPIEPCHTPVPGIFGGPRALLETLGGKLLDPKFITDIAVTDLGLRWISDGKAVVRTSALSRSLRNEPTEAVSPWEAIHDWRLLLDKRAKAVNDPERIAVVCPFHRGDVLLATQVAAHAVKQGKRVRLHVAEGLVSWVKDFAPHLDVEPVPVSIATPQETYPSLLAAYKYVSQRSDVSPCLARCHPTRSLSQTGQNLVEYILEELGLPKDTLIENLKPKTTDENLRVAGEMMQPFGQDVIFLHPVGGWSLKSIPAHILEEFVTHIHTAGFKLIQIGGAGERRLEACDGAILENFLPSQWREILRLGRALASVDSWTAHFGAILDFPQICFYGSTHPRHVNTKRHFAEHESPCLIFDPIVNCSPCNSLQCVAFPQRTYCTGYAIDTPALETFLARIKRC